MARDKEKPGDREKRILRGLEALKYRLEGLTLREIAPKLGISYTMVKYDIDRVLEETTGENMESIERMREIENKRIDVLWEVPYRELDVEKCDRLMKRRAALNGLDMPVKIAPTDPTGLQPWDGMVYNMPENPDKEGNGNGNGNGE